MIRALTWLSARRVEARGEAPRRRRVGRTLLALAGVGVLGMLLLVGLVWAISAGLGRALLVTQLERWLGRELGAIVHLEDLRGPLYPELELLGLAIDLGSGTHVEVASAQLDWRVERDGEGYLVRARRTHVRGLAVSAPDLAALAALQSKLGAAASSSEADGTDEGSSRVALRWDALSMQEGALAIASAPRARLGLEAEGSDVDLWPARASLQVELDPGDFEGHALRAADLSLDWTAADGALQASGSVDTDAGRARARGRVDLATWLAGGTDVGVEVSGDVEALDLGRWLERPAWTSELTGPFALRTRLPVSGELDPLPATSLELDWSGATGRPEIERVQAELEVEADRWQLRRLGITGPGISIEGRGSGSADGIDALRARGDVAELAALPLAPWTSGTDLAGSARLEVELSGAWRALSGAVALDAERLGVGETAVGRLRLEARAAPGQIEVRVLSAPDLGVELASAPAHVRIDAALHVDDLRLRVFGGQIALAGSATSDRLDGVELRAEGLAAEALGERLQLVERLRGRIDGVVRASGRVAEPKVDADLRWSEPAMGAVQMRRIDVEAHADSGKLAASLRALGLSGERTEVELEHPRWRDLAELRLAQWPADASLRARLEDLPLVALAPWVGEGVRLRGGWLEGSAQIGSGDRLPALRASLRLREPEIALADETQSLRADAVELDLRDEAGRLVGQGSLLYQGERRLRLDLRAAHPAELPSGTPPWSREDFEVEIRTESWDVAPLAFVLPPALREPSGPVTGLLRIGGRRDGGPVWSGELAWTDGSLRVPLLRQTFGPIQARIAVEPEGVRIEELTLGPPAGGVVVTGGVTLDGLAPERVDLLLRADRLALARSPRLRTDLSGEVRLSGPIGALELAGQLTAIDARIDVPDALDLELAEIQIAGSPQAPQLAEVEAALPPIGIDVELTIPPQTRLTGQGLDARLEGSIAARQERGRALRSFGSVRTIRGTYRLYQTRFDLESAEALFDGSEGFDPLLDVRAGARAAGTSIAVAITGRASDPQLSISSDPPRSETDLFALVLLGRPLSQLEAGQVQSLGQTISELGNQFALAQLRDRLKRYLPVDSIETSVTEEGTTTIEVGKEIRDGVFVRYGKGLGGAADDRVKVDVEVSPSVRVEGQVSRNGEGGADVIWSKDY